jgi:hypothetical protein
MKLKMMGKYYDRVGNLFYWWYFAILAARKPRNIEKNAIFLLTRQKWSIIDNIFHISTL